MEFFQQSSRTLLFSSRKRLTYCCEVAASIAVAQTSANFSVLTSFLLYRSRGTDFLVFTMSHEQSIFVFSVAAAAAAAVQYSS